jgi:dihydroorotate dehydrogenase
LSNFGFGFIEIGTLTPKGQDGNQKAIVSIKKEDSAIVNGILIMAVFLKQLIKS